MIEGRRLGAHANVTYGCAVVTSDPVCLGLSAIVMGYGIHLVAETGSDGMKSSVHNVWLWAP